MAPFRVAIVAASLAGLAMLPAAAQEVTLTTPDGALTISGELLGFDGEFYRIDSIYGEVTLDGAAVLCQGPGCPDLNSYIPEITLSGAPTIGQVLMPALIEAFALQQGLKARRTTTSDSSFTYHLFDPGAEGPRGLFHVKLSTTDEGFADLLTGEADIAMALRQVTRQEASRGREAGLGDLREIRRGSVLALDALVPLVSARNPVTDITLQNLKKVLAGELSNWMQLGGPDAPVALHLFAPASGLGQATEDHLFPGDARKIARNATYHMDSESLAQTVAQNPLALGIGSRSQLGLSFELALSSDCGFTMLATRRAVKAEDYPLNTPMLLYPARRLPGLMRDFLAFTRAPAAQLVIRRAGFVDQLPEEIALNDQGDRLATAVLRAGQATRLRDLQNMIRVLRPLKRLTPTVRFDADSAQLDAQASSTVDTLVRALNRGYYDDRELILVGFSDSEDPDIALSRAETLRDALLHRADPGHLERVTIDTRAFGEALPIACNASDRGLRANRRVETWLR